MKKLFILITFLLISSSAYAITAKAVMDKAADKSQTMSQLSNYKSYVIEYDLANAALPNVVITYKWTIDNNQLRVDTISTNTNDGQASYSSLIKNASGTYISVNASTTTDGQIIFSDYYILNEKTTYVEDTRLDQMFYAQRSDVAKQMKSLSSKYTLTFEPSTDPETYIVKAVVKDKERLSREFKSKTTLTYEENLLSQGLEVDTLYYIDKKTFLITKSIVVRDPKFVSLEEAIENVLGEDEEESQDINERDFSEVTFSDYKLVEGLKDEYYPASIKYVVPMKRGSYVYGINIKSFEARQEIPKFYFEPTNIQEGQTDFENDRSSEWRTLEFILNEPK